MAKSEGADYEAWRAAAEKALRGRPVDSLTWRTPGSEATLHRARRPRHAMKPRSLTANAPRFGST